MAFSKRSVTAKYMGDEPDPNDWDGLSSEELKSKIHDAFRWYYRFYDFKESMEFVQAYYKKNKVKSKSPGKLKINDLAEVGNHVGYLARLKVRGLEVLPVEYEELFIQKLKKIEEIAKQRKVVVESKERIKPDIQQRIRDAAKKLKYDIEDVIDEQVEEEFKKKFNFKQFLERNKVSKPVAKHLKPHIEDLASEIKLAKAGDVDFKEAYSHMSGHQQNRLIKFYDMMIEECEVIITSKKKKEKIKLGPKIKIKKRKK
ncbi:MAG: hypothetical protein HRS57_03695 [Mycoplasmataceae bacterium]|nr:hypothetical protein [Mycoplasmataceae bacterium]